MHLIKLGEFKYDDDDDDDDDDDKMCVISQVIKIHNREMSAKMSGGLVTTE